MCFNGIYRTNRQGQFNVPLGVRTGAIPTEAALYRTAVALRSAELRCGDFEACLQVVKRHDFVYLDPPYAVGKRPTYGEYGYGGFGPSDASRLVDCLERIDAKGTTFLLSYAADPELIDRVRRWNCVYHSVRHHVSAGANHRRLVDEILVSNRTIA